MFLPAVLTDAPRNKNVFAGTLLASEHGGGVNNLRRGCVKRPTDYVTCSVPRSCFPRRNLNAFNSCPIPENVVLFLDHSNRFLNKDQTTALKFHKHFKAVGQAREAESFAEKYRDKRKFLALVAHNNMKSSLMEFCKMQSENLEQFPLIATGTTGSLLYKETGLILARKVASGPLGGDQAVGTLISTNNICGVIFFRDPLSAHPHHADIEALGRLCDVYQIPFATNPQSGEAILDYLLSGKAEQQTISNQVLETYQRGQSQVITQHLDNSHPS